MVKLKEVQEKVSKYAFFDECFANEIQFTNEKIIRCSDFKQRRDLENCYTINNTKEKTLIQHAKDYQDDFPNPKNHLLLYIRNESGMEKFICSFIKPTKLGYTDLFQFDKCARFISNYVSYEALENPVEYPQVAVSPYTTLEWQKGDSLDMSLILASLLIGVGYDAYVVCGIADRNVTNKYEGNLDCPYIEDEEAKKRENIQLKMFDENKKEEENEYYIPDEEPIESKYEKLERQRRVEEDKRREKENRIDDDEPDRQGNDKLYKKRVHFWIYLRKNEKRDTDGSYFIDPPTGNTWSIEKNSNLPFFYINQIFNDKNVWVSKRFNKMISKNDLETFDNNSKDWDTLLPVQEKTKTNLENKLDESSINHDKSKANISNDIGFMEDNIDVLKLKHLLDMPLSWVPKLSISPQRYYLFSKTGKYTKFYKKVEIDFYSDYHQPDGLIKKITIFNDFKRLIVKEIRLYYKHRSDNLYLRKRFPSQFKTIDYYLNNNSMSQQQAHPWPNWKEIETIDSKRNVIRFYPIRFSDGLLEREEIIGEKTIERFSNRDDNLIYSSVRFEEKENESINNIYCYTDRFVGDVVITKMVEKYQKVENKPANEQIAKIIIDMKRNKIKIWYHIEKHEIAPLIYEISRDQFTNINSGFNMNSNKSEPSVFKKNQKIYIMEKECFSRIKFSELNIEEDFKVYRYKIQQKLSEIQKNSKKNNFNETENDILIRNIFAINNNKPKVINSDDEFENDYKEKDDIVGQMLKEKGLLGKPLDKKTSEEIKKEIVYNLQNRYIERSEIINQRFEDEKVKVKNLQKKFQRKANEHITKQEEIKFETELQQFNLKLSILEQRLLNFQKTAYEKYEQLQQKLNEDKRLIPMQESEDE